DSFTDAAGSVPATADPACVLDVAQPAARTARANASGTTDMECRIFVPSLMLEDAASHAFGSASHRCIEPVVEGALHPGATRGGQNSFEIGGSFVRKPLAQTRRRWVGAEATRLRPRTPCFVRAPELAQQDGAVEVRRDEIGILLHEPAECIEGLLRLVRQKI